MAAPLAFVVSVSMVKDCFEDRKRTKSDEEENNRPAEFIPLAKSRLETGKTRNIEVGCIVKVMENQFFPADLILLNSALPKGVCYVETKSLDGETNLKYRQANADLLKLAGTEDLIVSNFSGAEVTCDGPNEFIYNFEGIMKLRNGISAPLCADNFLLRGSQLRNCPYVFGLATYTGHETKSMKNSAQSRMKKSKIDKSTDFYIAVIILI